MSKDSFRIKKVAVLGSGVMGSQIAAHLANAGYPSYLLDIVPQELTEAEKAAGLNLENPKVRNRLARQGLDMSLRLKPAPFFDSKLAKLITIGNFEDNLDWLSDVDWIIEAIVERLDIKQTLMQKIADIRKPGTIVTTNTSGISVRKIAENMDDEFKSHFLGVHFFNPPRYMHLLEIIPTPESDPALVSFMSRFGDRELGKGIVYCKDTPNFIGNRIGVFSMMFTIHQMLEDGLSIEAVDAITGPVTGRPKSATFRTADVVGIDTFVHVARNLYEGAPDDEMREKLKIPDFVSDMVQRGWLGEKTKQGFYRKQTDPTGKRVILAIRPDRMDFEPVQPVNYASLAAVKSIEGVGARIKTLANADDSAGRFLWETLSAILIYSANRIPEISDSLIEIDNAMKWGYNWKLGPFETWDAIGVKESVQRMESEGKKVPDNVHEMVDSGQGSFYTRKNGELSYFDFAKRNLATVESDENVIELSLYKEKSGTVDSNDEASLIDFGDGVALLEFHSKMNTVGAGILTMINKAIDTVEKQFDGLIIGNQGSHFSAGANILMVLGLAQNKEWDKIEDAARLFQDTNMRIKYAEKPIVVAPFGMTLGGACEIQMHAPYTRAAAESYIGLVEVGVGLIPAAGGTKELTLRALQRGQNVAHVNYQPFLRKVFETIGMAKVSTSALEAKQLGLLRDSDDISMNTKRLLGEAKQAVLAMSRIGYRQSQPQEMQALGSRIYGPLLIGLDQMHESGFISKYDKVVGTKLAFVIAGGNLTAPQQVDEQYFLDLEREAFVSLCGEKQTQERMEHMLKTGKPLRN